VRLLGRLGLVWAGFVGGFMVAAAIMKRALPSRGDADSDEVSLVAVFDGANLRSRATSFRGGSMLAWYGGIDADLREAKLAPEARISVTSLFGGISLRVPPEWRIESNVRTIAGGVGVSGSDPGGPDAPRLILDGFAAFGGIGVSRQGGDQG
jgi:Cell wall-active antibiotics response 4TMS YvqF